MGYVLHRPVGPGIGHFATWLSCHLLIRHLGFSFSILKERKLPELAKVLVATGFCGKLLGRLRDEGKLKLHIKILNPRSEL